MDAVSTYVGVVAAVMPWSLGVGTVIHVPEGIKVEELDAESFEQASGGLKTTQSALLVKNKRTKAKSDISKESEDLAQAGDAPTVQVFG